MYYQIYLVDNEIPEFDIDKKFEKFYQINLNIEEYLIKNINKEYNKNEIIDRKKINDILNSDSQKKIIQNYEKKNRYCIFLRILFNKTQRYV